MISFLQSMSVRMEASTNSPTPYSRSIRYQGSPRGLRHVSSRALFRKKPALASGLCNFVPIPSALGFCRFRLFRLLFLSGGGFGWLWRGGDVVHPFEDGLLRGVAGALLHPNDARVAAVAFLEGGRDVLEQNPNHVLPLAPFLFLVLAELDGRAVGVQA